MDYVLSCCSSVDVPMELLEENNIKVMHYKFMLADKVFQDDGGKSISFKDFYQAMRDGASTKTSQVNVEEFTEFFRNIIKNENKDILHVAMSSGISGTYNCARLAAENLKEEFPDRKIYVVDSLCISCGYGMLLLWLNEKRHEGLSIEALRDFADENKLRIHHWFYSTDLSFYVKGGRISKVSGFIGSILKICPVMNVNFEGKLVPRIKTLGKKKALQTTVEQMLLHADNRGTYDDRCYINHSDCEADAIALKEAVETTFPTLVGKIYMTNIGTTIGCHSGPGTVAVYFLGDKRSD